jgi:hypothetical protein
MEIAICAIMPPMMKKPPETKPLQVKLKPELLVKLDDLRRGGPDFPTRSGIIRDLIEKAHAEKTRRKIKP